IGVKVWIYRGEILDPNASLARGTNTDPIIEPKIMDRGGRPPRRREREGGGGDFRRNDRGGRGGGGVGGDRGGNRGGGDRS
ncbi:MAG TPA: hypothetical protein VF596_01365, partial [Pyrinomonadaceae bacterium]